MKILVFGPFAMNTPHFETELEIIQGHLDSGDEAIFLGCNSELLVCDANTWHHYKQCVQCIGKRTTGLALLSPRLKARSFLNLSREDKLELNGLKSQFSTTQELRSYYVERFDIGLAVLSSIISLARDPDPDLEKHAPLVKNLLLSSFAIYRSLQNHIDQLGIDKAYVFNGRLANVRAAVRAFESRNIEFCAHERVYDIHRYGAYENSVPHDLVYVEDQIRKLWAGAAADAERNNIGEQFFLEQRALVLHQGRNTFLNSQEAGRLPEGWDPGKINVVIFNSSEDERAAVGDAWTPPFYPSQLAGLQMIVQSLSGMRHNLHLYLRVHPNLRTVKNEWLRSLLSLKSDSFTVIPPDASASTYAMLDHSDKVLTFGSTTGIEAVYWGKPSILAGQSFYRNLGGTYNPRSHDELMTLLSSKLSARDKEPALMYGYFKKRFGVPFKLFRATDIYKGEYRSTRLQPPQWAVKMIATLQEHPRLEHLIDAALRYRAKKKLGTQDALGREPTIRQKSV